MSTKKTFRFSEQMLDDLGRLASSWNVDQTEAIRLSLRDAIRHMDDCTDESHTQDGETIEAMKAHIKDLQGEIEARREETRLAWETVLKQAQNVSQAHVLNAADKMEALPETTENPELMSWWERTLESFKNRKGKR